MTPDHSLYNMCSDWLIVGHCSPVMPTGRLWSQGYYWPAKPKQKAIQCITNNLLTSKVRSLWEILQRLPCCVDHTVNTARSPQDLRSLLTLVSKVTPSWVDPCHLQYKKKSFPEALANRQGTPRRQVTMSIACTCVNASSVRRVTSKQGIHPPGKQALSHKSTKMGIQ